MRRGRIKRSTAFRQAYGSVGSQCSDVDSPLHMIKVWATTILLFLFAVPTGQAADKLQVTDRAVPAPVVPAIDPLIRLREVVAQEAMSAVRELAISASLVGPTSASPADRTLAGPAGPARTSLRIVPSG